MKPRYRPPVWIWLFAGFLWGLAVFGFIHLFHLLP